MKYKAKTSKNNDKITLTLKQENENTLDKDQLQYLINFVEEFKNYIDFQHITDFLKFILLPLLQDEEKRTQFINTLEIAQMQEETEITERLKEDPEALLDSIPHTGLTLIKNTLADFQALDKKEKKTLIQQVYRKPPFLTIPNTKLSNYLFNNTYDLTEPTDLTVNRAKKKEIVVNTQVFVSLLDADGAQLPQNITAYDRAVHDGVCSILAHNKDMTATNRQIYEAIAGKSATTTQALSAITRSLNKLRNTTLYLNYSQQAQAKGISLDKMIFDGNLLNFIGLEITSNGQTIHGYKFLSMPILYEYALNMGQIITIDKALLDIPNISNTDESIVLRHYMLRRIETMKNTHNNIHSHNILFSSMFDYCGIKIEWKTQGTRKRKLVYDILQAWINVKYIKGFKEYKEGRNIIGIKIELK